MVPPRASARCWTCRWRGRGVGSKWRRVRPTSNAVSACSSSSTSGIASSRRHSKGSRVRAMTPEQVTLVQQTFGQVAPIADKAAEIFYDRLFEVATTVKPLFQGDMAEQRRKLIAMLAVVVRGLSDLPSILPAASALAKRHVDYGARPEHYPVVGAALLWTLERGLGPQWTSEAASAWTAAYSTLSSFMIAEAYGSAQAAE